MAIQEGCGNIILTNLLQNNQMEFEVCDEVIKYFNSECSYFKRYDYGTLILTLDNSKIISGFEYTRYRDVNNELYSSYYTNSYQELAEIYKSKSHKQQPQQLSLF